MADGIQISEENQNDGNNYNYHHCKSFSVEGLVETVQYPHSFRTASVQNSYRNCTERPKRQLRYSFDRLKTVGWVCTARGLDWTSKRDGMRSTVFPSFVILSRFVDGRRDIDNKTTDERYCTN